jgi:uncharacterized protein YkwD
MKLSRRSLSALLGAFMLAALAMPVASNAAVCYNYRNKETQLKRQTNDDRARNGVDKLKMDPQLSRVARKRANHLAKIATLVHTSNLSKNITHWRTVGENIGYNYSYSVSEMENMFMDSPTHRANILKPSYRYLGIGTKEAKGRLWVVVLFESQKDPGTTLSMPHC